VTQSEVNLGSPLTSWWGWETRSRSEFRKGLYQTWLTVIGRVTSGQVWDNFSLVAIQFEGYCPEVSWPSELELGVRLGWHEFLREWNGVFLLGAFREQEATLTLTSDTSGKWGRMWSLSEFVSVLAGL